MGLLDVNSVIHRICLYIVFQPRIQQSLEETASSWNLHTVRTAGNKSPVAIYNLSRELAITGGYWTGDPGDDIHTATDPFYGYDESSGLPPADELASDPIAPRPDDFANVEAERAAGIIVNDDEEIQKVGNILDEMKVDPLADDGNSGIDIYCQAVLLVSAYFMGEEDGN